MRKRRFARLAISDDEDEEHHNPRKRLLKDEDEEHQNPRKRLLKDEDEGAVEAEEGGGGAEEDEELVAEPVGEVIEVSGKGRRKKKHYAAFEYDGKRYELEDPVLLVPEVKGQKPYIAIIKQITQDVDGSVMITGQWFYRPEEAEKKGGGIWPRFDSREIFYSFHLDDVPAESVIHKCIVHFIPLNKQLPKRSQHPGFIVQKVYDAEQKKLFRLTDKDYKDHKQHEIDLLVQKTHERLGELPDIEIEESAVEHEDLMKTKWNLRRKNMVPIDVSKNDDKTNGLVKPETPASCPTNSSEYYTILATFKALTTDTTRDRWIEKLLQGIRFVCNAKESASADDKAACKFGTAQCPETGTTSQSKDVNGKSPRKIFFWPDDVIPAIAGLEKAAHDALGFDFQKYNQKMRQLAFNLKSNELLATRLLKEELVPSVILNMSPAELKDGLTAEEKTVQEPERPKCMQMTDARCSRCMERKVGVAEVIAGGYGDRYQLECTACGYSWYSSRDAISSLTIDASNLVGNVGTAPWATAKFEDVEKKLVSPRESEKPGTDVFVKTTAAYMPVLEPQRSFKGKTDDVPPTTN